MHSAGSIGAIFADASTMTDEPEIAAAARRATQRFATALAGLLERGRAEGDLRADLDASAAAWWLLSLVASQKFRGATAADPAEVEARLAESTLVFLTQEAPSGFGDPANRANVCYTATRGVVVGRHSSARLPPAPCGLST